MPPTVDHDPRRLDPAFALVRRQVDEGAVPSAVLAVAAAEGPVRCEAFAPVGEAGIDVDSRFLVASITKPIVATAVLQLVEAGLLVLSEPVSHVLPGFAPSAAAEGQPGGEQITTWHLLTHTSGIPELPIFETLVQERPDRHELLRRACADPLRFAPGSRYEYGSNSFYVLGELIHRVTGLDYPDYLAQRVLGPLGMSRTSFDPLSEPRGVPLEVAGYDPAEVAAAERYFTSLAHPGGGLWATAADIVRFGRALLGRGSLDGERILSPAFVELMTREQTAGIFEEGVPPRAPHYGLGWWKAGLEVDLPGSATAFAHTGATGTILWVDPDADLVVVYLMNVWGAAETHRLAALQAIYASLG